MPKCKLKLIKVATSFLISAAFLSNSSLINVFSVEPGNSGPKVSVIIPVYNAEQWLQECLQSVWNQTLNDAAGKDFEIICVDDKSTDGSAEILTAFSAGKPNVHVFLQEQNGGPSPARNRGLEAAQGEYIGFVDSDDCIDPDMYEHMYMHATQSNADIVHCRMKFVGGDSVLGRRHDETITATNPHGTVRMFMDRPSGFVTDKLFRHELIKTHGISFDNDLKGPEDTVFAMQCYGNSNCVVHCPDGFYNYRKHEGSISDWKKAGDRLNMISTAIVRGVDEFLKTTYGPNFKKQLYTYIIGWASSVIDSIEMHMRATSLEKTNFAKTVIGCLSKPDFAEVNKDALRPQYKWLYARLERLTQAGGFHGGAPRPGRLRRPA